MSRRIEPPPYTNIVKQPRTWFWNTAAGRRAAPFIVFSGSVLYSLVTFLPEHVYCSEYVDFVRLYKSGLPVEVPDKMQNLFKRCFDVLGIPADRSSFVKTFTVFGFEVYTIGTMKSRYCAHIGLPEYFYYDKPEDVRKDDIQIEQKPVDWLTPEAESFADSLILSEGAKTFAVCREILIADTNKLSFDSFCPAMMIFATYGLGKRLAERAELSYRIRSIRLTAYGLVSLFGLGVYFFVKDTLQWYYERTADDRLAKLGPEMIDHGIEYYGKMLQRNKALRKLMKEDGKSAYTGVGNEVTLLRTPHIPLTLKKKFLEDMKANLSPTNDTISE